MKKRVFEEWESAMWMPPPELTIDQWAGESIILPRESGTSEPGPFNIERVPYLREILRAGTDPDVEEITLCFSTQTGKTTAAILTVLYYMDQDPWPAMHVMAREKDAHEMCTERYQPIIRASPKLARHLTGAAHDMTMDAIHLNGCAIDFPTAASPAGLASKPKCILVFDEPDKYPPFSGREADPIELGRERTRTFANRKILKTSSPTTERGYIWQEYLAGDRRRYHVPCPHCGVYQEFVMGSSDPGSGGIKWPPGKTAKEILDESLAWYQCAECHGRIEDIHKPMMLVAGVWCPEGCTVDIRGKLHGKIPSRRCLSYHISCIYSPWLTFSAIAAKFLNSKDFPAKLMNFRNSWLALIWEDKIEELKEEHLLVRVGGYDMGTVPPDAQGITGGVDVQGDHFWYVLRAWGSRFRSWLIREGRLERWEDLDDVLFGARYLAVDRNPVPIHMVMIDARHRTDEVYQYCKLRHCQAVMGHHAPSRPFHTSKHVHPDGAVSPLVLIDTDYFKCRLHRLTRAREEDHGAWHLPVGTPKNYFTHMVAEQRVLQTDKKTGRTSYIWTKPAGVPNHLFDCEVYALAAADAYGAEHRIVDEVGAAPPCPLPVPELGRPPIPPPPQATKKKKPPRFQKFSSRFFT